MVLLYILQNVAIYLFKYFTSLTIIKLFLDKELGDEGNC